MDGQGRRLGITLAVVAACVALWFVLDPLSSEPPPPPDIPMPDVAVAPPEPAPQAPPPRDDDPVPAPVPAPAPEPTPENPPVASPPSDDVQASAPVVTPAPLSKDAWASDRKVAAAVARAVTRLRQHQSRDGSWGEVQGDGLYAPDRFGYTHPAGTTALAVYALLSAGVPSKHPAVKKGFAYLMKFKRPPGAVEASMILLAVGATASRFKRSKGDDLPRLKVAGRYRQWAVRLVDRLKDTQARPGWRYLDHAKGAVPFQEPTDLFSTHLAARALFTADRLGVRPPAKVWASIVAYTNARRVLDASADNAALSDPAARGYGYVDRSGIEGRATGGMSACAVANLQMARIVLSAKPARTLPWDDVEGAAVAEAGIRDSLLWLEKHWSAFENPHAVPGRVSHPCWLWNLSTALELRGRKRVGKHDWYAEISAELLRRQRKDGTWKTEGSWGPAEVLDTSFAILVLTRATERLVR